MATPNRQRGENEKFRDVTRRAAFSAKGASSATARVAKSLAISWNVPAVDGG